MLITKHEIDYKPVTRKILTFSGVVKVEGVFAARQVALYNHMTYKFVGSTLSNPNTGAWSIGVSDTINIKYFAICFPNVAARNAEIFTNLTGV